MQVLWWRLVDDRRMLLLICRSEYFQLRAQSDREFQRWRAAMLHLGLEPASGTLYHFVRNGNAVVTTTPPPASSTAVTCFRREYECGYDFRQDNRRIAM